MSDEITSADLRQVLAWLDKETLHEFQRAEPELWNKALRDLPVINDILPAKVKHMDE
jgi:Mlc titration factor MtfA (ptsG expression regulator)